MENPVELAAVCPLTTEDVLRRAVGIAPELEAVVTPQERVGYAELASEVATIRSALAAAGVGRGDHVGVCLGNGPRWVALFLAIGSLGAVTVGVNTRLRAEEIGYVLRQSRVKLLFLADRLLKIDFVGMLREICPRVDRELPDPAVPELTSVVVLGDDVPDGALPWAEFLAAGGEPVQPRCTPEDVLLLQYTSGTTSRPKGALLTHRGMCADAFFSGGRLGLRTGDRFYSARPFFHVAGSTLSVLGCLQQVATLVAAERFEPGDALGLMETERCTHFSGNDTIALMLLNHPDRPERRLVLRGAWLAASPTIARRVIDELGAAECVVGYGLSEASPNVAQSAWWEPEEVRVAGRMRPEPGVAVRIRDVETGMDCPTGTRGEILVRGWNVMRGYYDMPAETAEALDRDGWLHTGDIGLLDESGRLEFLGREKDIIRVGGENVAPAEVENVLHGHPKIRQAVVVGVPDERLIEVPFAFVVLNEDRAADSGELLDWAKARMAGFKVPRHLLVVEGFERFGMTASAKVQKRQLVAHAERLLREGALG
ncbi:AMP-binding protein [Amycolatopsis cihanbeyliensis]|uniref:Fatty-acyl-CoA synthase n=1 Tax=Amycolatopsis cihanbeyliensis TaxID=1128664 RepID=A0A542DFW4_AMYCI|nr:AMP-binding protein [Amycolatopsis cihanbeyliensis]TQJ01975.1 fatty-acyl-CoA synthase [Amycolatopsis cihanbeyliensis]